MSPNKWPVNISKQEVTHFSKTERPDGYDLELALRFERTNNTSMETFVKGAVTDTPNGREWTVDIDIQGAAVLTPAQLPVRIATKITYGDIVGETRANTVEITTQYGDGRIETKKEVRMMPVSTPSFTVEEYLQRFAQMLSGKPFDKLFLDEDIGDASGQT